MPRNTGNKRKGSVKSNDAPAGSVARPEVPPPSAAGKFSGEISAMQLLLSNVDTRIEAENEELQRRVDGNVAMVGKLGREALSMMRLNVGGVMFEVPIGTLLSEEGSLFHIMFNEGKSLRLRDVPQQGVELPTSEGSAEATSSHFQLDRDPTGAVMIDRDPIIFRHILNYLRGYRRFFHLGAEEISMLQNDAMYYQLEGLIQLLKPQQAATSLWQPGPGVNFERTRFRVQYGVATLGEKPMICGRHSVIFEILDDHYLGVGVVSNCCTATDQEFHKTMHCAVYYMTGVFYSNFPVFKKEENLDKFEVGDIIKLTLDMDDKTFEVHIRGKAPKIISCAQATSLRFAVTMKLQAAIRILDEMPPERTDEEVAAAAAAAAVPTATATGVTAPPAPAPSGQQESFQFMNTAQ